MTSGNPLREQLRARIDSKGPITFCQWMEFALYDPEHGYYRAAGKRRWGREGDYRTCPERSTLFSATFARYFAQLHKENGGSRVWTILEGGAGEGFFAAEVLATLREEFTQLYEIVAEFGCATLAELWE
jgi:SAM-dependent MidA family methyltransferase